MQVIAVNHGNVFGTGKWFTFYCGKCERQLNAGEKKCKHCGEKALYEGAKNTEQAKPAHKEGDMVKQYKRRLL